MSNRELQNILSSPDKNVGDTTNALARLYRTVLRDHNMGYDQFSAAITRYLTRASSDGERSREDQMRDKGNLIKELTGDSFTFKNFIKGLKVLNPVSAEIHLILKWKRGRETVHTIVMNIQDVNESDDHK